MPVIELFRECIVSLVHKLMARHGFAVVVDQLSSLCVEIVEMERSHSCGRNMFNFAVQFIVFNGVNG